MAILSFMVIAKFSGQDHPDPITYRKPRAAAHPTKHLKCHERKRAFYWQFEGNP
jgi:hypothetical protein